MISYSQLGAPGPNDLSSYVCSRREMDETRRLRYRLNPSKHRLGEEGGGGGGRGGEGRGGEGRGGEGRGGEGRGGEGRGGEGRGGEGRGGEGRGGEGRGGEGRGGRSLCSCLLNIESCEVQPKMWTVILFIFVYTCRCLQEFQYSAVLQKLIFIHVHDYLT